MAAAVATVATVSAQNTYSGYFLDNYTYRYEMNPAFGNSKNYIGMPGLGNVNVAMHGTLHLSDILYNVDGKTVLFTNPGVAAGPALDKFKDNNRLSTNNKFEILSGGFKAFGGYNTINISAVANVDMALPESFFPLLL